MRDDFSNRTKDILSKRVGMRCSNPECRRQTSGPNSNEEKVTNIGVAAHITAASSNGPRYNKSLTATERKGIKNGIWLCQSCAKLIDSDTSRYNEHILRKWKQRAESEMSIELFGAHHIDTELPDFLKIFQLMPKLINEMKADLHKHPLIREFILQRKGWIYNPKPGKTIFEYYYEDHDDLEAKVRLLESNELVEDITWNNTKRYLLKERFCLILKGSTIKAYG